MLCGRKPLGTVAYMGGVLALAEEFTWCWGQMIQFNSEVIANEKYYVHYDRVQYSDHAPARNTLAGRFLGDWLLMLDTDHVFEPDLLHRMLHRAEKYEVDVIAGLYQIKRPPYPPVMWVYDEQENLHPVGRIDKRVKLLEIGAAGAGALWVRRKVYDKINEELKEEPFSRLPGTSEDHSFFRRLHKLGIKAYCDPKIQIPHLRVNPITMDDLQIEGLAIDEVPTSVFL